MNSVGDGLQQRVRAVSVDRATVSPAREPGASSKRRMGRDQQDGFIRQQVIGQLMRQIMNYDADGRAFCATMTSPPWRAISPGRGELDSSTVASHAKH